MPKTKKRKLLIPDLCKRYRETVWPWQQPVEVQKQKLKEHLERNHDKIYSFDYDLHRYYNTMSVRSKPEKRKENFAHEPPKKKPKTLDFTRNVPSPPPPGAPKMIFEDSKEGLVTDYYQKYVPVSSAKETTVSAESRLQYVSLLAQLAKDPLQHEDLALFETLQAQIGYEQTKYREHIVEVFMEENGKRYRHGSARQCMLLQNKTNYEQKECKKYPQHYKKHRTYNTKDIMESTEEVTSFLTHHALKQNGIPLEMNVSKNRKELKDSGVASKFPEMLEVWFEPGKAKQVSYNVKTPNKPVSRDEETLDILKQADVHYQFVSSTSALTRLFDIGEDLTFSQDVLIPVTIREINGRKSVFLDKKLPNATETLREKRERRLKNVWRGLLSTGESTKSPEEPSIQWRKVTLQGANILVRSNMHGKTKNARGEEMHIIPAARLDYVSGPKIWGWQRVERATVSDRLRWWMKIRLRHEDTSRLTVFLGRVNAVKRIKAMTETFTNDNVLVDDFEMLNIEHLAPRNLRILKGILDELAKLKVGYYLFSAKRGESGMQVLTETPIPTDKGSFDLHNYAESCGSLSFDANLMVRLPEVFIHPGTKKDIDHIPDLFPIPNTAPKEEYCRVFETLGVCKELEKEMCRFRHFKTFTMSHCWEFAALKLCPRGNKCGWAHFTEEEVIDRGRKLFHIRQVLTYCMPYLKGNCTMQHCQKEHLTEAQLFARWDAIPEKHLKPDKLTKCIEKFCYNARNHRRRGRGRRGRGREGRRGRGRPRLIF